MGTAAPRSSLAASLWSFAGRISLRLVSASDDDVVKLQLLKELMGLGMQDHVKKPVRLEKVFFNHKKKLSKEIIYSILHFASCSIQMLTLNSTLRPQLCGDGPTPDLLTSAL